MDNWKNKKDYPMPMDKLLLVYVPAYHDVPFVGRFDEKGLHDGDFSGDLSLITESYQDNVWWTSYPDLPDSEQTQTTLF